MHKLNLCVFCSSSCFSSSYKIIKKSPYHVIAPWPGRSTKMSCSFWVQHKIKKKLFLLFKKYRESGISKYFFFTFRFSSIFFFEKGIILEIKKLIENVKIESVEKFNNFRRKRSCKDGRAARDGIKFCECREELRVPSKASCFFNNKSHTIGKYCIDLLWRHLLQLLNSRAGILEDLCKSSHRGWFSGVKSLCD